jgi:hypothetical protein
VKDDAKSNNESDALEDLMPTAVETKQGKKSSKGKPKPQKTKDQKKKSFRRSWQAASPITKLTVWLVGLAAAGTVGYFGVTVWQTLEVRWAAHAQHMPLVIMP